MVMLLEGRHLQFFVHRKLDPSSSSMNLYKFFIIFKICSRRISTLSGPCSVPARDVISAGDQVTKI